MIIKTYRGEQRIISDFNLSPQIGLNGTLVLNDQNYNGNQSNYRAIIHADKLLLTAKLALAQLSNVSGVKYKIVVEVADKSFYI